LFIDCFSSQIAAVVPDNITADDIINETMPHKQFYINTIRSCRRSSAGRQKKVTRTCFHRAVVIIPNSIFTSGKNKELQPL
jgi:hypothetical protein